MKVEKKRSERERKALWEWLKLTWVNGALVLLIGFGILILFKCLGDPMTWKEIASTILFLAVFIAVVFGATGFWFYYSGEAFPSWAYDDETAK